MTIEMTTDLPDPLPLMSKISKSNPPTLGEYAINMKSHITSQHTMGI